MTSSPEITEVLRRGEIKRAVLKDKIAELSEEVRRHEMLRRENQVALVAAQAELATLEHILEPLGDQEVAWCATEKTQATLPQIKHRASRRDLTALVLEAVQKTPGLTHGEYSRDIGRQTGMRTFSSDIEAKLQALRAAGEIEWRDGWFTAPEAENAQEATQEAHTSAQDAAGTEIPPEPETATQKPPTTHRVPDSETTLDYIRRAGTWLTVDFQLRKHAHNLDALEKLGHIERGQDEQGRPAYRYVDRGETAEAAK